MAIPKSLKFWIPTCVVAFALLAIIAFVLFSSSSPSPLSLSIIDSTSSSNPLPPTLSIGLSGGTPVFPTLSNGRAALTLQSAVEAGKKLHITVTTGKATTVVLSVPKSVDLSHASAIVVITDKSIKINAFGKSSSAIRQDVFVTEFSRILTATDRLDSRYFTPADNAYHAVFGGKAEAPRINIYNAIRISVYPKYLAGTKAASSLSSTNPLVQSYIDTYSSCVSDWQTEYSDEQYADDPNVYDTTAADAVSTAAANKAQSACDTWQKLRNHLVQELRHP